MPDDGDDAQPGSKMTVPLAKFIGNVEEYLEGTNPDEALKHLDKYYRQYKMLEQGLLHGRARLLGKLPEIEKAKTAVEMLRRKAEADEEVMVDFQLADAVFAKACVPPATSVNLWLGANVMLEYSLDEALEVLEQNLRNCQQNLEQNRRDLELIKDSITTSEVSMARIFNYDVTKRRARNTAQPAGS